MMEMMKKKPEDRKEKARKSEAAGHNGCRRIFPRANGRRVKTSK